MPDAKSLQAELQQIFRNELHNPAIVLEPDMRTGAIEGWDSFANVEILLACEERWGFRFSAAEIDRMRTFGDLLAAVAARIGRARDVGTPAPPRPALDAADVQTHARAQYDASELRRGLGEAGLVLDSGVKGVWGRGTAFEDVVQRFDDFVTRETKNDGAQVLQFPPVLPRSLIEKLGYLDSFPQLAGSIHSFFGSDADAREIARRAREGEDWESMLQPTEVMLTPAACYPVYPNFSGLLPGKGRLITVTGWVFRHEPSDEPTRLQSFRMREFIRLGRPDEVVSWRDAWLDRGLHMLRRLGLDVKSDVAADPFFGRTGTMIAARQRDQRLKFEILVPVISEERPTAVCSFNWHQEHFSGKFGIRTEDGATAHTACMGFGLERVALALFNTHGFEPREWPRDVRALLWPAPA